MESVMNFGSKLWIIIVNYGRKSIKKAEIPSANGISAKLFLIYSNFSGVKLEYSPFL